MSMNNLTIDGEFRYIVQWFTEWSELQRDDFVPILVKYITGSHSNEEDDDDALTAAAAATTPVNMNGLPNDLEFNGRPMSLFQCRIKLFNQWNRRWPSEFKEKLQQKIIEIDDKVGEKIMSALNPNNIEGLTNGYASVEIETMTSNDPMTEVLNKETSVDDIETNEDFVSSNIEQPLTNIVNTHNNDDVSVNNEVCNNNIRRNHAINETSGEPVEQVEQMQNLQINEEKAEVEKDHEDVTAVAMEQQQKQQQQQHHQQQPLPTITVTVNPVVVTQTITTNSEVPLVV